MTYKAVILAVALSWLMVGFGSYKFSVPGWHLAGTNPEKYILVGSNVAGKTGGSAAFLVGLEDNIEGFGTMMQIFPATKFEGQRVRFSARIRATRDPNRATGLWMRIDDAEGHYLSYDEIQEPLPVRKSWTRFDVVLDVPAGASNIAIGIALKGNGALGIDDVKFETVPLTVPITGTKQIDSNSISSTYNLEPTNLDFKN
jgi:hypothetical protein